MFYITELMAQMKAAFPNYEVVISGRLNEQTVAESSLGSEVTCFRSNDLQVIISSFVQRFTVCKGFHKNISAFHAVSVWEAINQFCGMEKTTA